EWEKVRDGIAARLREWADAAKSVKIVIAVKPHAKTALHSPDGGLWLHKQVNSPWLRLAYDQSHYAVRGWKLADTLPAIVPSAAGHDLHEIHGWQSCPQRWSFSAAASIARPRLRSPSPAASPSTLSAWITVSGIGSS